VLSSDQARDIARRLGATWVVVGGVTRSAEGPIVLDVTLRDVNSGKRLLLFTVSGTNPIAVADEATARLVSGADANAPGPHLADVETANLAAYQHYVRASQAYGEGRTPDCERELDAAIAADSGFVSAIVMRLQLARNEGDVPMESRLGQAYNRAAGRATNWDQLDQSLFAALHNGENERAEALAREMVTRYPHDPTAYSRLADVLQAHGHFAAADSVFQRALSLDSLATLAGSGPCAPCAGYGGLAQLRADFGDLRGAEQAARRWVELQPDIPLARSELALVLAYEGRFDAAVAAARRALWLGGDASAPFYQKRLASLLIMARRYDAADSIIQSDLDDPRADVRGDGADLLELLQRERGQYRASARTIEALVQRDSSWVVLEMVRANSLGRAGDVAGAEAAMRRAIAFHPAEPAEPVRSLVGDRARKYAWEHAMRADVLRAALDTVQLAAIADSVQAASARSYYGRDWGLSHHLRGLIAQRAGRYDQAVRDFQAARWGHGGWSRTNVELARSYLALRRPDSAVAVLRDAYRAPLDAMGRYVPRSELDFWMATAMARAGMADSAAVYGAYVRRAWDHADPDVRARLAALPH
jgi:tetratricopeptide (TPR) repeat protein